MSRRLVGLLLGLVLVGWLLPGCGSGGDQMSAATAATLQRDVDAVTSATNASRWDAAFDALDRLEADVAAAQAAGALSDQRARQIRAARLRVLEDVQRVRAQTPSPKPTPAPSKSPTTRQTPSVGTDGNSGAGGSTDSKPGKQNDKKKTEKGNRDGKGKKG